MGMASKYEFREQYLECIDHKGNILNCGREACKRLIHMAEELTDDPPKYYGDAETGIMNVEHLRELHKRIKAELPPLL